MSLAIVPSAALPLPPYPSDTRAGNYAVKLDMTRVHQSTTYLLASRPEAPPELRAWLIFLWCEAWTQIPMATLPDDDELICAVLRIPKAYFDLHRPVLMRGWKRHADGRLYHDFLTGLVLATLRERARYKRHREQEQAPQPVETATRNVAPLLPLRADVDVDVDVKAIPLVKGESEGKNARATAKALRGSRMQTDQACPEAWSQWVCSTYGCNAQRAVQLFIEFRDYWADVPGERGLKLTWFGTFKNRCRAMHQKGSL